MSTLYMTHVHIVPGTVCSKKNEVHKFVVHNFVYQHKFCAFSLNYLIYIIIHYFCAMLVQTERNQVHLNSCLGKRLLRRRAAEVQPSIERFALQR